MRDRSPAGHRPRTARRALLLAAAAAVPYFAVAGNLRCDFQQSPFPYHVLAADAMLHGQFHLRDEVIGPRLRAAEPAVRKRVEQDLRSRGIDASPDLVEALTARELRHDLAIAGDRLYIYWPPLTSVLVMPWVALFGPGVSDRLINALFGAINVGLAYWMFRRVDRAGLLAIGERACVALTLVFAFGTPLFWLSCDGRIWYAVQVLTLTPLLLSIVALAAPRLTFGAVCLAGAGFGAAILGRSIVAVAGLFYPVAVALRLRQENRLNARTAASRLIGLALPLLAAAAAQAAYNYGRFGDPLENGHILTTLSGGDPIFYDDIRQYGRFSPHYFAKNFKHYVWCAEFPVRPGYERRWFHPEGNSLFLVTPPLLYCLMAWRQRRGLVLAAACGAVPLFAALLFYHNTGYVQFGNRYLLDAMPLLLLLAAAGMNGTLTRPAFVLCVASVAINVWGTVRVHHDRIGALLDVTSPPFIVLAAVAVIATAWLAQRRPTGAS